MSENNNSGKIFISLLIGGAIGGAVAYKDYISPSGVGFDIACGNKAVMTDLISNHILIVVIILWMEMILYTLIMEMAPEVR